MQRSRPCARALATPWAHEQMAAAFGGVERKRKGNVTTEEGRGGVGSGAESRGQKPSRSRAPPQSAEAGRPCARRCLLLRGGGWRKPWTAGPGLGWVSRHLSGLVTELSLVACCQVASITWPSRDPKRGAGWEDGSVAARGHGSWHLCGHSPSPCCWLIPVALRDTCMG